MHTRLVSETSPASFSADISPEGNFTRYLPFKKGTVNNPFTGSYSTSALRATSSGTSPASSPSAIWWAGLRLINCKTSGNFFFNNILHHNDHFSFHVSNKVHRQFSGAALPNDCPAKKIGRNLFTWHRISKIACAKRHIYEIPT